MAGQNQFPISNFAYRYRYQGEIWKYRFYNLYFLLLVHCTRVSYFQYGHTCIIPGTIPIGTGSNNYTRAVLHACYRYRYGHMLCACICQSCQSCQCPDIANGILGHSMANAQMPMPMPIPARLLANASAILLRKARHPCECECECERCNSCQGVPVGQMLLPCS